MLGLGLFYAEMDLSIVKGFRIERHLIIGRKILCEAHLVTESDLPVEWSFILIKKGKYPFFKEFCCSRVPCSKGSKSSQAKH